MKVIDITSNELPVVNFSLTINGGQWLDPKGKADTAALKAQLLNEGTTHKTPQELEQVIGQLGAQLSISADRENIELSGHVLAKHYPALMELTAEMLSSPRWDENEFERLKSTSLTRIKHDEGDAAQYQVPFIVASQVRTNVTLKSLRIFKELIGQYQSTYQEEDSATAQNRIIKLTKDALRPWIVS